MWDRHKLTSYLTQEIKMRTHHIYVMLISLLVFFFSNCRAKVSEEELDQRFDKARELAKQGEYEEALQEYLFVFDNSRDAVGWGGVRLSYVPGEIADIGREYPPALKALVDRRNKRQRLILDLKAGFDDIHELTSLNRYLGEPDNSIGIFDKLKTKGPDSKEIREDLAFLIWEDLVDERRYRDLRPYTDYQIEILEGELKTWTKNPDFPRKDDPHMREFNRTKIIDRGKQIYEVLIGTGEFERASEILRKILEFETSAQIYRSLIDAATRADNLDIKNEVLLDAEKKLSKDQFSYLKAMFFYNRGITCYCKGDIDCAILNYTKATEIYEKYAKAFNSLAWILATCPSEEYRNGEKAVRFAGNAVSLQRSSKHLDTLAAAYAEVGDFGKATEVQIRAIDLVDEECNLPKACCDEMKCKYERRLRSYRNNQAWRE